MSAVASGSDDHGPHAPQEAYRRLRSSPQDETEGRTSSGLCSKGARGLLAMLMSSFQFSLMALLVKYLREFSTFEVVFWRSIFMFALCIVLLRYKRTDPIGPRGDQTILILRGVAGFGFMGGFYFAIKSLPLSDAVVITYTAPVITAVAAAALLGEAWGRLDAAGSLLCLAGVVLISKPTFVMGLVGVEAAPLPFYGTLGAVFAAVSATGTYLLLRYARHLDPFVSTNYFAMVGIVLSPAFGWVYGETWHWPHAEAWLKLVLLALLSVLGQACMNIGLALQTAAKATAMNYVQVVFAFAFQAALLHEGSDVLSVVGATMIASWGGVALLKEALRGKTEVVRRQEEDHEKAFRGKAEVVRRQEEDPEKAFPSLLGTAPELPKEGGHK
mmetsp:Transcript_36662/g.114164  ORF Transcript_36662/g.114164 Transcript_36662/m.114164 type:complete len:386 (+) Transcript_36662:73-1230(+)